MFNEVRIAYLRQVLAKTDDPVRLFVCKGYDPSTLDLGFVYLTSTYVVSTSASFVRWIDDHEYTKALTRDDVRDIFLRTFNILREQVAEEGIWVREEDLRRISAGGGTVWGLLVEEAI